MRVLNVVAGDAWSDLARGRGRVRRAVIVGGTDDTVQVRIDGELREYSFRYFVRRFDPVSTDRYREI